MILKFWKQFKEKPKFLMKDFQSSSLLQGLDETQVKLMNEECILVNQNDEKIGTSTKKNCHLLENIKNGMLHRAFSVFLFNNENELLLQQRSAAKITFPNHWTNTCCSHPLNTQKELVEDDALGVKRAAQRKLNHELGIPQHQVPTEKLVYLTRIQYMSHNVPEDGIFGEHEIDYVLIYRGEVDTKINENEVRDIRYIKQESLKELLEAQDTLVTPWFRLICKNLLIPWWNNINSIEKFQDATNIHRLS